MAQNLNTSLVVNGLSSDTQSFSVQTGGTSVFNVGYDGRVGIGTTTPSAKLDIFTNGSSPSEYVLKVQAQNGSVPYALAVSEESEVTINSQAANNIIIGTPNNIFQTYHSGNYLQHNTNLLAFGNSVQQQILAVTASTFGAIGMFSNHDFRIRTNNSERVTIDTSGNVGIGTTAPTSKFHVMSTLSDGIKTESIQSGHYILASPGNNSFGPNITSSYALELKTPSAEIRLGRTGGTGNALIYVDSTITTGLNISANAGGSPNLTLLSNGNVGAGTSTPLDKFHINNGTIRINDTGSTYGTGKLAVSDANGSISFSSTTALGLGSGTVGGTGTVNYVTKWSSTTGIANSVIYDDGTNVGIGTTTPTAKVEIIGLGTAYTTSSLSLYSSASTKMYDFTDKGRLRMYDPTGTYTLSLEAEGTTGLSEIVTNKSGFVFDTASGEYNLRRTSAGNILLYTNGKRFDLSATVGGAPNVSISTTTGDLGVGTTAPTAKVDIRGSGSTSATTSLYIANSSSSLAFQVGDDRIITQGSGSFASSYPDSNIYSRFSNAGWFKGGLYLGTDLENHTSNIPAGHLRLGRSSEINFYADYGGPGEYSYGGQIYATDTTGLLNLRGGVGGMKIIAGFGANAMFIDPSTAYVGMFTQTPSDRLHVSGGTIRINTSNGTEGAGKLAVSDANGSISFSSTTALGLGSGTVGGTGTAGKIAKWSNSTTLTDSLISETGTGVTVSGSIYIYGNVDVLGTATTFNTTTVQTSDNNITMNLSGSHVSALYGGITILSGKVDNTSSTLTIDSDGNWSANTSAVTINGARVYSDGQLALNNSFWAASSNFPYIGGSRNLLVGNNDTGTFSLAGSFNNLIGSFTSVGLTTGQGNTFIGNYNTLAGITSGSDNIGIKSNFSSNISGTLAIGSTPDASNSVFIGNASNYYQNWYLGLGKSATFAFGATDMNWYASGVAEGDADKNATIPVWRINGSRATGSGSSGDIRFAVSLSAGTGTTWNPLVDKIALKGNSGFVGINNTTPTVQLDVIGDFRVQDVAATYGAGKIAVSDSTGKISFSSTTALSLGAVNKYSTTLTTPGANVVNTITHNLGTTDINVSLWLVATGELTGAKVNNRTTNTVDVIFAVAPGEDVRVVITG